MTVFYDIST